MEFSKEELCNMSFDDAVEMEEPGILEAEVCCMVCGDKLENLEIGYNQKEQLYRYECKNCDSIFVMPEHSSRDERVLLQGEERDWPEYLMETLTFPFLAELIESDDRVYFDPDYDGPSRYDTVKVLEVFYSLKYGVEALVRKGRRTYQQILSFLEAEDYESSNYVELENYKRWREKYWLSDYIAAIVKVFGKASQDKDEDEDEED